MLKFLALGDSYTLGEGLPAEDNWPHLLVKGLRAKDVLMAQPEIIAQTGWTSSELLEQLLKSKLHPPYDLVSLLVGVNNQYRGLNPEDYAQEFETLLKLAIDQTHGPERVFVLSIPDWGVTPFAAGRDREQIAQQIDALNKQNARLAYRYDVHYLNVTQLSRLAQRDPNLLAEDRLHYSELMYRRWVMELLPKVWRTLFPHHDINIPLLYQQPQEEQP